MISFTVLFGSCLADAVDAYLPGSNEV